MVFMPLPQMTLMWPWTSANALRNMLRTQNLFSALIFIHDQRFLQISYWADPVRSWLRPDLGPQSALNPVAATGCGGFIKSLVVLDMVGPTLCSSPLLIHITGPAIAWCPPKYSLYTLQAIGPSIKPGVALSERLPLRTLLVAKKNWPNPQCPHPWFHWLGHD